MTVRFYIMPKTFQTIGTRDGNWPKYFTDIEADGATFSGMDWPGWYLVRVDGTDTLHTTLNGFSDTLRAPLNLTNTIGGALAAAQTALELTNMPADWMNAGMTWKEALRGIGTMCQFWQRIKESNLFGGGRTLATPWSALPTGIQTKMITAADSWGMSKGSLTGASTLRQILRSMGSQWVTAQRKIILSGEEL